MNSPGFSLLRVDAGDLSKPANTLIKCISKAIGGLYEPTGIVRRAKAEARARLIEAESDNAALAIEQRAACRSVAQESLYQENSEKVIEDSLAYLEDDAKPEDVSSDWYVKFFDKAKLVSDEQMRILWSKILAGEANIPGSFSRRTLSFVDDMDKREAELFTQLCGFNVRLKDLNPIIFDGELEIYKENGINFESLTLLDSIGLIKFGSLQHLTMTVTHPRGIFDYFDRSWILEFGDSNNRQLKLGKVILTNIGQELAPISGSQPVPGFAEFLLQQWEKHSPKEAN